LGHVALGALGTIGRERLDTHPMSTIPGYATDRLPGLAVKRLYICTHHSVILLTFQHIFGQQNLGWQTYTISLRSCLIQFSYLHFNREISWTLRT